jgi:hypothetical protein
VHPAGRAAVAAAVLGSMLSTTPADAHDHRPPRAVLRHGGLQQEGRLVRLHWSSSIEDGGCVSSLVLADVEYPERGLPVGEGRFRATLRLSSPERPAELAVVAREGRGDDGRTLGRRRDVRINLRPRRPNDRVIGWTAVLRSRVRQDLYLKITGTWKDREGCLGSQRATWAFHVTAE